jgi:hypothetical protein
MIEISGLIDIMENGLINRTRLFLWPY